MFVLGAAPALGAIRRPAWAMLAAVLVSGAQALSTTNVDTFSEADTIATLKVQLDRLQRSLDSTLAENFKLAAAASELAAVKSELAVANSELPARKVPLAHTLKVPPCAHARTPRPCCTGGCAASPARLVREPT